jgi:thiamine pyrophosphate-dependent acetolactate synthase large subunit-like protein
MSQQSRILVPTPPVRLRRSRHTRRTEAADAPDAKVPEEPALDAAEFLRLVAPIVLCLPAGQLMPLWLALLARMDREQGQHGVVSASEDFAGYEAIGLTLAEGAFGKGRPGLLLTASASPALKVMPALWAAQWRRPFVLVTGECASNAERGTVQDSRGIYGASLVDMTAQLTQSSSGEPGSFYLDDPVSARAALLRAPSLAIEHQKAVHLNIPVDIQAAIFGAKS